MSTIQPTLGTELKIWTEWHALAISCVLLGILAGFSIRWFSILAGISFFILILQFKMRWTPSGVFGSANAITLLRLAGVCLLLFADPASGWVGAGALFLFALDAVDGWVARRRKLCSEFGEFFDKEVDAFFLLVLCLLLYSKRHFGLWILIPGLLRYGFVAYLKWIGPGRIKEQRSRFGCWSYFLIMVSLISAFIVNDRFSLPLIVLTTFVLCASFADTIRRLHWPPRTQH